MIRHIRHRLQDWTDAVVRFVDRPVRCVVGHHRWQSRTIHYRSCVDCDRMQHWHPRRAYWVNDPPIVRYR